MAVIRNVHVVGVDMQSNIPLVQSLAMLPVQIRTLGGGKLGGGEERRCKLGSRTKAQIQTCTYVTQPYVKSPYLFLFALLCRLSTQISTVIIFALIES